MANDSDRIRDYGREKYVKPARERHLQRFPIRTGDVVRSLKLNERVRQVCLALKSKVFLESNGLKLVDQSGPPSGQSTTVVYTYELAEPSRPTSQSGQDGWTDLRGALKNVFADLGGGEAYLRGERENFYADADKENA
jgi:hypothetical protein